MSTMLIELEQPTGVQSRSDVLHEIIDGEFKEKLVGIPETLIAGTLYFHLALYLRDHPIGLAAIEGIFRMNPSLDRQRRPDIAFVSNQKLSASPPNETPWRVAPDLVVEVVSEHDAYHEVLGKVDEYFEAGVKVVWLVSNRLRRIQVYRSSLDSTILAAGDVLDGGSVLPGFRLPLDDLFGTGGGADSKTG